jgi:choline kinase
MSARYEAVILAAGRGSRLAEHTRELPKALLPIGPRSLSDPTETCFLRRQIELLLRAGVESVVVVVGTLREQIEAAVADWRLPVTLVVNPTPDMGTSGSLHSFQFALRAGLGLSNGTRQTLLMDADIVYDARVLQALLDAPARTSTLVARRHKDGDDEQVLVYGTETAPRFLGKGLSPQLVGGAACLGEATGIVKLAPEDHGLARAALDWMLGDPGAPAGTRRHNGYGPARRATEHEELSQRLMLLGRMACVCFDPVLPFMECDDAAEYRTVREQFYPALLQLEQG